METIFNDMYNGLSGLDDILHGFVLMSFLPLLLLRRSGTGAFFVHAEYR